MRSLIAFTVFIIGITAWSCGTNSKDKRQIKDTNDSSSCVLRYDSALRLSYYSNVDKDPIYVGGLQEMAKIISKYLKYPSQDCARIIDPEILVGCIISSDGELIGKTIIKGFPEGKGCNANKDALETVDHLTYWIPGQCADTNVTALFIIPIKYEWSE